MGYDNLKLENAEAEENYLPLTLNTYAFANATKLAGFELPKRAVAIGNSAFYKSSALKTFTFEERAIQRQLRLKESLFPLIRFPKKHTIRSYLLCSDLLS